MGLFSGLFGSETTETDVADWIKGPAQEMLQRSLDMGKTGYMPWTGPVKAQVQDRAMRQRAKMRGAFGMDTSLPNLPVAQDFGNGISGYSSMPLYEQNLAKLRETRPGQMAFYDSFFVDPVTGANGANMAPTAAQASGGWQGGNENGFNGPGEYWTPEARRQRAIDDVLFGHHGSMAGANTAPSLPPMQGPQQPGQGLFGGIVNDFRGFRDGFKDAMGGLFGGIK